MFCSPLPWRRLMANIHVYGLISARDNGSVRFIFTATYGLTSAKHYKTLGIMFMSGQQKSTSKGYGHSLKCFLNVVYIYKIANEFRTCTRSLGRPDDGRATPGQSVTTLWQRMNNFLDVAYQIRRVYGVQCYYYCCYRNSAACLHCYGFLF